MLATCYREFQKQQGLKYNSLLIRDSSKPKRIKGDSKISQFEWPEFECRLSALQSGTQFPTKPIRLQTLPVFCFHHLQ